MYLSLSLFLFGIKFGKSIHRVCQPGIAQHQATEIEFERGAWTALKMNGLSTCEELLLFMLLLS